MSSQTTSYNNRRAISGLALGLLLTVAAGIVLVATAIPRGHASAMSSQEVYLPVTITDGRRSEPPALLKSLKLENALCPNDIAINQRSGHVYITNEQSNNVSLLQSTIQVGNIDTGEWPIWVESDPRSVLVYVSNVVSGISVLQSGNITAQIPPYHEPYNITVNTVNGYTYVVDLHRPITILRGDEKITDLFVPNYDGFRIEWQLASGVDLQTGLTYFASWQKGILTVVDGLQVKEQFPYYGEGAKDMVIDSARRKMYTANFRAGEDGQWYDNISVVDLDTHAVTGLSTATNSRHMALDAVTGFVYVTNPEDDTVTVLLDGQVSNTYYSGERPWGVAVDPVTGFAYVANSGELSVTVFRDGAPVTKLYLPVDQGFQPWQIGVDTSAKQVYVINRSSREVQGSNVRDGLKCYEPWVHIFQ